MKFKEWEARRNAALEVFREFLKILPEKGLTVDQLETIGKNAEREINAMVTDIKRNIVFSDGKAILISDNDKAEVEITTDGERIEPAELARTVLGFCEKQKYSIDETRKVMLEIMQAVNESTENLQRKSKFKFICD